MNDPHWSKLEFDKLRARLVELAVSPAGRALAERLAPSSDYRRVTATLTETEEAKRLLDTGASVPLSPMEGMETVLGLLGKGVIYSEAELSRLAVWLTSVAQMKKYMLAKQAIAPTLGGYALTLQDCPELRGELDRCLRYGRLTDHASPELADIRRHLAAAEEQIKRRVEQSLGKYRAYLQEGLVSKRNGHYVLPVRKENRKQVQGTVWDESASGQTLFVEPADVAGLQAEYDGWKADESREESVILARLSELAERHAPELKLNVEAMATFDFIFARAKLAGEYGGRRVELVDEPLVKLAGARHPLLGADAVPLSAEIGGDCLQLMITGPNTGGKTVALKTIGLLALMTQAGLLVPAGEGTRIGLFRRIMADIGDGQSVEQSLSTFSAHIGAVRDMMAHADDRSLLLLDELAAGTDPGEGIALAIAVLEELLARESLVVATTHFNEIKTFAARTAGCRNARMAFDPATLRPLYRLEVGEAGDSYALTIARKYGMPERIVARAEQRLRFRSAAAAEAGGSAPEADGVLPPYPAAPGRGRKRQPADGKRGGQRRTQGGERAALPDAARGERPPDRPLQVGDSVWIYPLKRSGIVFRTADERGEVVVQVQQRKLVFNRKRLALRIPREELYPDSYDLDIVFESVENRKKRKLMSRKHAPGTEIVTPPDDGQPR